MNVKLKILRKVLEEAINNIDAGNSNHSDNELDDIISSLTKLNKGYASYNPCHIQSTTPAPAA